MVPKFPRLRPDQERVEGCLLDDYVEGVLREVELGHVHLDEGEVGVLLPHVGHADGADVDVGDVGVAGGGEVQGQVGVTAPQLQDAGRGSEPGRGTTLQTDTRM